MSIRLACVAVLCLTAMPALAVAQEFGVKRGEREYMVACAGCHGDTGKGTGPIAQLLKIETPDLTTITKRSGGGAFPYRNTTLVIDGRNEIRAHGGDMPVWGDRFQVSVTRPDSPWASPDFVEMVTMGRILALVQYLESIQEE